MITGLGLLLVLEREKQSHSLTKKFRAIIENDLEILLMACISLVVYFFIFTKASFFFSAHFEIKEPALLLVPVLFLVSTARKKTPAFLVTVLGLVFFVLERGNISLPEQIHALCGLFFGLVLFELGMEGLRWRLLFSNTPKIFSGKPVLFLAAALLALSLNKINFILK